jgi:hypothetical protein
MKALITGALAASDAPGAFLLPARQSDLFRWALASGLRVVKPMTYMTAGEYREPTGAWIASVLYRHGQADELRAPGTFSWVGLATIDGAAAKSFLRRPVRVGERRRRRRLHQLAPRR